MTKRMNEGADGAFTKEKRKVMKRWSVAVLMITLSMPFFAGCGTSQNSGTAKVKLDPDNPVSLTVWHYYNGAQQATFDTLVEEFNATVGKEKGIYVEEYSQGSVYDLEQAVQSAIKGEVGADDLPDIFSSYADTAYYAQQEGKLVDLTQYFSEDELSSYVDSYIEEGYFQDDGALYLLPVAKSTEIMMINKTDWEPFAAETGSSLDELKTIEGVVDVAEHYYEWTDAKTPDIPDDGKAFYGRDSMSNYFIIGMKQMGKEIFEVKNGEVTINTDKESMRRLWDDYYVPYVKGYFESYGKFRSDDVKTGDILAYTGATSSAVYFPDNVENGEESYPIDYIIQDAPIMQDGENYMVQQGAGMAVTKSDDAHEYASCVFLKWITEKEQNLRFGCDSAYLPVLKEANKVETLDKVIKDNNIEINEKSYDCLKYILENFDQKKFYTPKSFRKGYDARKILDYNLSDKAVEDKTAIDAAIAEGTSRDEVLESYLSDEAFENWYNDFCSSLSAAAE